MTGKAESLQIRCIKKDIVNKEARGDDATFERGLLMQWSKYPGWETAGELPPLPKKEIETNVLTGQNK